MATSNNMVKCTYVPVHSCLYTKEPNTIAHARPWEWAYELSSVASVLRCFDASFIAYSTRTHTHTEPILYRISSAFHWKFEKCKRYSIWFSSILFFAFEWHLHKWNFPWKRGRKGGGWNAPKPVDSYFRSSNKQIDICSWRATLWKIDFTRMPVCHMHKQHFLKKTPHNSRDRKIYPSKCAAFRDRREEGGARGG